jgi:predicted transcriptional regulator
MRERGLTQVEATKVLRIQQPHVSALMRNRAGSFSAGRLIDFLTALGHDVEAVVKPARRSTVLCRLFSREGYSSAVRLKKSGN